MNHLFSLYYSEAYLVLVVLGCIHRLAIDRYRYIHRTIHKSRQLAIDTCRVLLQTEERSCDPMEDPEVLRCGEVDMGIRGRGDLNRIMVMDECSHLLVSQRAS